MIRSRTCTTVAALALALAGGGWALPAHAAPPSTTTLTLASATSAFGESVTATAQVVLPGGTPNGKVYFVVDGTSSMASINSSGIATSTLPRDVAVGPHAVSATFVPRYPDQQEGSESAPTTWVVAKARTFVQVRITGRGAHTPTAVVIGAVGDFGTRPTGPVSVTVRRLGTGKVARRQRTLDQAGAATARFGILRTGRYRLRVTYAGDAQHLLARHTETFTVRQR